MKIALIGYGKMGKEIEKIILEEGKHQILYKFSDTNLNECTVENLSKVDVAIDFTQPDAAYDNVMKCFEANIAIVVGTTAWDDKYPLAEKYCIEHKKALFVASNFSIGVNLFFELNKQLYKLIEQYPEYPISMSEIHHTEKKDAPSGTAVTLAKGIIELSANYKQWHLGQENKANSIPIEAIREESVPGTHLVSYSSKIDTIEIKHIAKSRKGFAIGAVKAAEFLFGKTGVYSMSDMLNIK